MRIPSAIVLTAMMIVVSHGADAASIPSQLHNKTITTSFTVTIPAKGPDGTTAPRTRNVNRVVYISSAGRFFSRSDRRVKGASETTERGPDQTSSTYRFDGGNLVSVLQLGTGASQLVVSFDSSFSSCTARVLTGGQGGGSMTWKGIDGKTYTSTGPATASSPSCSIQSGNPFAGQ